MSLSNFPFSIETILVKEWFFIFFRAILEG